MLESNKQKKKLAFYMFFLLAIVIGIIAFIVLRFITVNNIFTEEIVSTIDIGYEKQKVIEILGEPNEILDCNTVFLYFNNTNNYSKAKEFIQITFNNNYVTEVFFNKSGINEIENIPINYKLEKSDLQLGEFICNIKFSVNFIDGSFYRSETSAITSDISEAFLKYHNNNAQIKWTDKWGHSYTATTPIKNSTGVVFGQNCYVTEDSLVLINNNFEISDIIAKDFDYRQIKHIVIFENVWKLDFKSNKTDFTKWINLENIYYNGELSDWCQIEFGINPLIYAPNLYINGTLIENINIDKSINNIPTQCFANCQTIKKVTIENENLKLGNEAFFNCKNLKELIFNTNIYQLGNDVFKLCNNIQKSKLPLNISNKIYKNNLTEVTLFGNDTIPKSAFESCVNLKKITLIDNVYGIESNAFFGCSELEFFDFGDSIEFISTSAFEGCKNINSIEIGDNVKSIEARAFYGCSNLTKLNLSDNIIFINEYAFAKCNLIEEVVLPISIQEVGQGLFFQCTSLNSITLPFIGANVLGRTNSQLYYIFGDSIDDIPQYLQNIEVSGNAIFDDAFRDCHNIYDIKLSENITCLPNNAFLNCTSLCNINIPKNVTTIENAFNGCSSLITLTIPKKVAYIANDTFKNCIKLIEIQNLSQTKINYSNNIKNIYSLPTDKKTFEKDNFIFYKDEENFILHGYVGKDSNITLPSNFDNIAYSIDQNAFQNMRKIASIIIPNNITKLVDNMFYNCINLTSISLPNELKELNYGLFENCISIETIYLPEQIVKINQFAFNGCTNLKTITLHKNVNYIGIGAFNQCESLDTINYIGTIDNWANLVVDNISIGGNNRYFMAADIIYNFNLI